MIGIFDSGLGGLTVVKEVIARMPGRAFAYYGDTARMPYGPKGASVVRRYTRQVTEHLAEHGAAAVIVACNTASALAADDFASAPVPMFGVVEPAVRRAAEVTRGSIGVIGTRGTVGSGVYERMLAHLIPDASIHTQACPLFVPLVEEGWQDAPETRMIARTYLEPLLLRNIDTLILGCTHYPFLAQVIRDIVGPDVVIVDPAQETVAAFATWLAEHPTIDTAIRHDRSRRFEASDASGPFAEIAARWLGQDIDLIETRLE